MNAPERIIPTQFAVSLPVTQDVVVKLKLADGALELAKSFVIDSSDVAQIVADQRNANLKSVALLKEIKKNFVKPAKEIIANAEALFDPALEELDAAIRHQNGTLLTWQQSEDKRLAEERRVREAEERRVRQEAEQKAAALRAKAEEEERVKRQKAAEAEELRKQALEKGDAREASRLAGESAKLNQQADAAIENGNAKAQEVHMAATATVAATPILQATKVTGNSFRENWIAEAKPGFTERDIVAAIARAAMIGEPENNVAPRPELLALLDLNTSAARSMAKTYKGLANIPGMVTRDQPVVAGSRK